MGKIKQYEEKRQRNKDYALKHAKKERDKKRKSVFANWCRTRGHAPNCRVLECPSK